MTALSSQHHSFDIALAAEFGVECAILIHHFQHWIRINQQAKRNIREGRCWTYQSRKEILLHFPYWNFDEIRRLCEKLVNMGVLISKNFNKNPIDKTLWYAFTDEQKFKVDSEYSRNVYERQNCPSRGKIALREAKLPSLYKEQILKTTDTKASNKPPNPRGGDEPDGSGLREKMAFGKFVSLMKEDYYLLCSLNGKETIDSLIEEMNDYLASTGKKPYKDYAAALRTWIRNRKEKEKNKPKPNLNNEKSDLNEVQKKNWKLNHDLVNELKIDCPDKCGGFNFYYKHYVLKDKNNPNFDISALIDHRSFCQYLDKHYKLNTEKVNFHDKV